MAEIQKIFLSAGVADLFRFLFTEHIYMQNFAYWLKGVKSVIGGDVIISAPCPASGLGDGNQSDMEMVVEGNEAPEGLSAFRCHGRVLG